MNLIDIVTYTAAGAGFIAVVLTIFGSFVLAVSVHERSGALVVLSRIGWLLVFCFMFGHALLGAR
jgi:hypothetical protein